MRSTLATLVALLAIPAPVARLVAPLAPQVRQARLALPVRQARLVHLTVRQARKARLALPEQQATPARRARLARMVYLARKALKVPLELLGALLEPLASQDRLVKQPALLAQLVRLARSVQARLVTQDRLVLWATKARPVTPAQPAPTSAFSFRRLPILVLQARSGATRAFL